MAQRQYEAATVFNARIVDMRHLWEPSREYMGKPTEKPNYFASFIVPKTQAQWFGEPSLAGISAACGKIFATNPHVTQWPVIDGDMPTPKGESSEWAKGHWIFSASTGNPPNVELAQPGGQLVKLTNKVGVKSGDVTMAGVTAAVKQNDPRGVKLYLNAVVFCSPGAEIVFANSVSGAELMRMAQQQGLQVAGFAPNAGGFPNGGQPPFGGVPGGFPGAPGVHGNGGFAPQPGQQFQAPGAPGFTPPGGGFAPTTQNPAFAGAPGPGGMPGGGNATSHFNGAPGGFATPPNPFPGR